VLFFLGVLTAASDTDRIAPPPAIPLGVNVPGEPAANRTPAPAAPSRTRRAPEGEAPSGERPAEPVAPDTPQAPAEDGNPSAPEAPANQPAGDAVTPPEQSPADPSVPPAGEEPPAAGGSGGVEEVDGQVDCYETGTDPAGDSCPPGEGRTVDEGRRHREPRDPRGRGDG
jgi:hypothetical protein